MPLEKRKLVKYTCAECGTEWLDKRSLAHRKKFCSQSCLGAANLKKMRLESPTSIEVETYNALARLNIPFEAQYRINRWVVDVFLPESNTIIECLGDYFHCNPVKYPNGPRYSLQKRNIERDAKRKAEFEAAGYHLIELWESDIVSRGALALLVEDHGMRVGI